MNYFSFSKTYFIAEIGSNFDGSKERAFKLIDLAKESGADAAKFQNYDASSLIAQKGFDKLTNNTHQKAWRESVFDTYRKAELQITWVKDLAEYCNKVGLHFLSSAYSPELLRLIVDHIPFIKIGSGDISDIDFIKFASSLGKPIALATGASSIEDVVRAVEAVDNKVDLCIMQCNTNYESIADHHKFQNILALKTFKSIFPSQEVGLSCHMKSNLSVYLSVALGAKVIEKHFTDDATRDGPDHKFALTPFEFKTMVEKTRIVESLLGDGEKKVEANEVATYNAQRRSIFASKNLEEGHILLESDLVFLRPYLHSGYHPYENEKLIGKQLSKDLMAHDPILHSSILEEN
ncbi:N-acetylneuraminate synthase family protein [Synechococcus sp. CBW1107]|uniref:N-acetylneuraminate synthase family protein n=1 Tax=Synechococcus sp. CBW1107 TaxID=2789857 RepID=UPI002AD41BE4|nr:N-acetylneuraminate synthase family protein [Synechococcus sp. CBW1107]CAK6687448.1 N,N'-diacetyllegionaminic acid synthase [Synechococcus sp. CBW1107]